MIEAVCWDVGGVFSGRPLDAVGGLATEHGLDPDEVFSAIFGPYHLDGDHTWHRLERGQITLKEAWADVEAAIGAFGAGRLADAIGRRNVMMLAAGLFLVSAILAGAANSSAIFILARIIGGLGVGAASVIWPVYISEVTPASIRGRLSSVQQVMIITGLTGAFVANFALARYAGGSTAEFWLGFPAWRWMFWRTIATRKGA